MERKLVTILFADAIGSTSLGDRLDPERLRAVLDAYFATMASAVQAAILGPCCDRAEALAALARGDGMRATALLERAFTGFNALHAATEATATRHLLTALRSLPSP